MIAFLKKRMNVQKEGPERDLPNSENPCQSLFWRLWRHVVGERVLFVLGIFVLGERRKEKWNVEVCRIRGSALCFVNFSSASFRIFMDRHVCV